MTSSVRYDLLLPCEEMVGEDEAETALLRDSLDEARRYLLGHSWCRSIEKEFFGLGVGGVVCVFLFEIAAAPGVDEQLWVVCGDLPSAYLMTDSASRPVDALELYCGLMNDWVLAVRGQRDIGSVFPVDAAATDENARQLETRIAFLREEVVAAYQ